MVTVTRLVPNTGDVSTCPVDRIANENKTISTNENNVSSIDSTTIQGNDRSCIVPAYSVGFNVDRSRAL